MVDKILQKRRMKVRLQNTVRTIHGAVGGNIQDFIIATRIMAGTRAISEKGAFVPGQQENPLPLVDRVFRPGYVFVDFVYIGDKFCGNTKVCTDRPNYRAVCNLLVNI